MNLINFTNYNIIFFNLLSFVAGGYFILTNFEDLNKKNGIQDCYNVFLLTCLGVTNNLLPLISCFNVTEISILAFLCSVALCGYNSYNLSIISGNCSDYYIDNYTKIWNYYEISIGLQLFNIILYIIKFFLFVCKYNNENKTTKYKIIKNEETQTSTQTPTPKQLNYRINDNSGLNECVYPLKNIYEDDLNVEYDNDNFYNTLLDDPLLPNDNDNDNLHVVEK